MNLELKAMLAEGKITQEVFDELSKKLENSDDNNGGKPDGTNEEEIEKRIQSAVDRAMNKAGNEKKKLLEEIERMKKEKMTESERKEYELSEKEKEIKEREDQLKAQENRLYAIKAIKKAGLDDGSDTSLELVEFVMAKEEAEIDERVKTFNNLVKKLVQAEVDKTFKENGGKPPKSGSGGGVENPYAKETFNLTRQMELETTNPELANQLRQQAGK